MSFFYTKVCVIQLFEMCDKYETPLRVIAKIPTDSVLKTKHFIYHNRSQCGTSREYTVLGKLNQVVYWKPMNKNNNNQPGYYLMKFDNGYMQPEDPTAQIFMYENVKR